MKITWKVASAFAVLSSALCGGCQSPQEPVSISSSVDAVSLVDLPLPRVGKGIQISVRLAEADGASLELLQCTVSLSRFDGQRWDDVYTEFCALPAGVVLRAYPVVDGVKTWLFPAPDVPAGKYALQAGVRRAGRNELISVRAQFELSDAQTR
jgi:hypothetical protein